ncbi:hypothetical protein [Mycobacterium pseudokansasii]|uniref:hypothetical protein n=1 Tax=Mycobacterium pseudokansasii TaxID=2341080 RepID=UPI0007B51934|nr:hypothetical protein [Mycobacterium pseudokansasii]KZS61221.1 hypothetical protein A4G27_24325 [Mycobacterium kansasii]VAZ93338.1 hypothetical protein LAUMK35_02272 [Mycobacterium pseudokansasii]VAZ94351.1 hypothetical protein LAUMK21_02272 [Mycobacterium pseudokansasii]
MADDDFGFGNDFDEIEFGNDELDDDEPGATGHAALMCRSETLGVRFRFVATLDDALSLAKQQPCPTVGCIGDHVVAHRDQRGELRVIATAENDIDALMKRLSDLLRGRRERADERQRQHYGRRLPRLGLTPPKEDTDV